MMSGRSVLFWFAAVFFCAAMLTVPLDSDAGVNVNIGIDLAPPAYVIHEPPPVAVIPGSYVYFVPGIRLDILFYRGYWYRPYKGRWYRGRSYNGPWYHISTARMPAVVLDLPPDYRHARHNYRKVPYSRMKENWRQWEKERYWDDHKRHGRDEYRYDKGKQHRHDRSESHGGHGDHGKGRGEG